VAGEKRRHVWACSCVCLCGLLIVDAKSTWDKGQVCKVGVAQNLAQGVNFLLFVTAWLYFMAFREFVKLWNDLQICLTLSWRNFMLMLKYKLFLRVFTRLRAEKEICDAHNKSNGMPEAGMFLIPSIPSSMPSIPSSWVCSQHPQVSVFSIPSSIVIPSKPSSKLCSLYPQVSLFSIPSKPSSRLCSLYPQVSVLSTPSNISILSIPLSKICPLYPQVKYALTQGKKVCADTRQVSKSQIRGLNENSKNSTTVNQGHRYRLLDLFVWYDPELLTEELTLLVFTDSNACNVWVCYQPLWQPCLL